ncbi:hypothetical protein [Paraliomyxa miuraensis]|uniref:hypothetical protein n=1 Tax=Paraliomyxa miuraensis TaxID=376150 RepID=UPI00224DD025|nr:hypothetical protein [Paraliomyxa miuraensis]MCX4239596.1 hypothetical protein [Paraliomyxa miuraensis]
MESSRCSEVDATTGEAVGGGVVTDGALDGRHPEVFVVIEASATSKAKEEGSRAERSTVGG